MCPSCFASAALVIGRVASTGGLTALVARAWRRKSQPKASEPATWSFEVQDQPRKEKLKGLQLKNQQLNRSVLTTAVPS